MFEDSRLTSCTWLKRRPATREVTELRVLLYFPDTNILIDFGRRADVQEQLEHACANGARFAIAPPALIELTRGVIRSGRDHFENDKKVFVWLRDHKFPILPLPMPFMAQILHSSPVRRSGVEPAHYGQLIEMVSGARHFDDLIEAAEGTAWRDIGNADDIHNAQLDKELGALGTLANRARGQSFARRLSEFFGVPGCRPNPLIIAARFSSALEYLDSCSAKVRGGANPRRNDPGLYTDFQLLLYLADDELSFLTNEDFTSEIKSSRQRLRIVGLTSLPSERV
jgi:hypothetical protein